MITYLTLTGLTGYLPFFDAQRDAAWIYNPTTQTFWSYDDPFTVMLKTTYVQTRVLGGLGGAYVFAVKDDDDNGTITKTMAAGLQ
jgi:chitinase